MTGVSSEIIVEPEKDIILTGRSQDYVAADTAVHGSVMFLVILFIMRHFCLSLSGSRFTTRRWRNRECIF